MIYGTTFQLEDVARKDNYSADKRPLLSLLFPMGFCGECGSYLAPDLQGAFCPECGEAIPGAAPASARRVTFASTVDVGDARHLREEAERRAQEAKNHADISQKEASNAIAQYEAHQRAQVETQAARDNEARALKAENERRAIDAQRVEAVRRREEAERQAQEARDRAEAMRLSAQNAISDYEAQQRAAVERENARIQQELESQRQQHLQVAQAARERREDAERMAQEKLARAEKLRAEAHAAQEELKKQEAKRIAKERQKEEAKRLREEQARREANRRQAEEEARKMFEAKRQEDQLRQEALRLSTLSVSASAAAPATFNLCVSCTAALKPAQKFCLQCGTKVATAAATTAPRGFVSSNSFSSAPSAPSGNFSPAPVQRTNSSASNSSSSSSFPGGEHSCASCSCTLKATQKFCPKCGTKVVSTAPPPAPVAVPSPVSSVSSTSSFSAPQPARAAPIACAKCSQPLKQIQKFCLHCGTKVVAAVTSAAPTPSLSSSFSSTSSSSYTSVPLPAPIPTSGSWSAPSSQLSTKNCPTCSKDCKFTAKFCMGCGFNFAKSDDEEVARNIEAARLRQQRVRDQEQQQRTQASLMANQAAQAHQASW
ncbi:unnamed protein product [Peronospora belbahrii]|uniref:DZANK-type domain-containing protein n=1 Tax=Peronospora belbahrii TaxID=622444 RepID=A0AAU9L3T0_9STRA|nr:unnamed protein product [Peronospora belbahrii]CAH0521670.1 unnamed protein product [Peronospora belbahrii]